MRKQNYYSEVIDGLGRSAVEGTLSILGINNAKLRKHLHGQMGGDKLGSNFLADPVYEATFPWAAGNVTMDDLSGKQLNPYLVDSMDQSKTNSFKRHLHPYKHQLKAWNILLDQNNTQSVIVTSGTGSGKTECFMVPILNDLANQVQKSKENIEGVQALFLYPLNALINSQRERLSEWTSPFGGNIRFCLYNGNTAESKHQNERTSKEEVLTRKTLRKSPPPILVTNSTMLEYMLVRQDDAPILEKSQGKLKWIVLDEAHTYTGSQAAEMSLLIRRTLHQFGVKSDDVRFIATSATIGDEEADDQLKSYLAQMAGVSDDRIVVVGANRSVPVLDVINKNQNLKLNDIVDIEPGNEVSNRRFQALVDNSDARHLRDLLSTKAGTYTASDLASEIWDDRAKANEVTQLVDLASSTFRSVGRRKEEVEPFIPIRGHLYHQVLNGVWCCTNSDCIQKQGTELETIWPFGHVYVDQRIHCLCGSPVFELTFCRDCNEPHLLASNNDGKLEQTSRESIDEFSLAIDSDDEDTGEDQGENDNNEGGFDDAYSEHVIITPIANDKTYALGQKDSGELVGVGEGSHDLSLLNNISEGCSVCDYKSKKILFYRRCLLGTPFYVSNSVPHLLNACDESSPPSSFPNRGRKLITFTDSRQGTARIATKIQQDSERDALRGLVYHEVLKTMIPLSMEERNKANLKLDEKTENIANLKGNNNGTLDNIIKEYEEEAAELQAKLASKPSPKLISWQEMIGLLAQSDDIRKWIYDYYRGIDSEIFSEKTGTRTLAELLLLREFWRRPKRASNLETLGLIRTEYPLITLSKLPERAKHLGFTTEDWHDLLKVSLDFHIRADTIINIPDEYRVWIGAKIAPKSVFKPDEKEQGTNQVKHWPKVRGTRSNRLIRMISLAFKLDLADKVNEDKVNGIMADVFAALTKVHHVDNQKMGQMDDRRLLRLKPGGRGYHLDKDEIYFTAAEKAWVCPITNRVLDTTFRKLSPYLPFNVINVSGVTCSEISIPLFPLKAENYSSDQEWKIAARDWLVNNDEVVRLRSANLWTDLSDGIIQQGRFFRVAEHSAQQPQSKLQKYESAFKANKLNVLCCSTTMEMGVDIGGISIVAMNNVPPHPANYLQRSGRAGRRKESQALAFTVCKDNPHERMVFNKPKWPFVTKIPAPYINLSSERIIQRHINATLLSYFIKQKSDAGSSNATSLTVEWFFEPRDKGKSRCSDMIALLESWLISKVENNIDDAINSIKVNTILGGDSNKVIVGKCIEALGHLDTRWQNNIGPLKSAFEAVQKFKESDPYRRKVQHNLSATLSTYLLSDLANRTFLPTYGFPTGIASFDHYTVNDYKKKSQLSSSERRDDNINRIKDRPGRSMPMAIREYSPGNDVILDGRVHKSSGLILREYELGGSSASGEVTFGCAWRCVNCGAVSNEELAVNFDNRCKQCGSTIKSQHLKEFIEPEGFAVDFYSTPTVDVTSQTYIPVQAPWVTANTNFEKLYLPTLGGYRSSSMGHIFHHSSGEFGKGFAVCLRCGRAESMTADGEFPAKLRPDIAHDRLQGKAGAGESKHCDGPDGEYSIRSNIHLGKADTTDVFELYLKDTSTGDYLKYEEKSPLLWTLAVALRQALANVHGINADEIGYTVSENTVEE